jgi:hypothetical protein
VKIVLNLIVLFGLLIVSPISKGAPADPPTAENPTQHFVCSTGYTVEKCRREITVLRKALEKYPAKQLGEWTWVLVLSSDWERIHRVRGMDLYSPAFTFYQARETFIEEALVTDVPGRQRTLLISWRMSMPTLLDFAIAHELGHALCNEPDEGKAERVARLLRDNKPAACQVTSRLKNGGDR